jgi:hypothetical protein
MFTRPLVLALSALTLLGTAPCVSAQETAAPPTAHTAASWEPPIKFTAEELREIFQLNQAFLQLPGTAGQGQRRGARPEATKPVDAKTFLLTLTRITLKAQSRDPKASVPAGYLEKLLKIQDKLVATPQQEQQVLEIAKTAAQQFKAALSTGSSTAGATRGQRGTRPGKPVQGILPYMEQNNLIANQETHSVREYTDIQEAYFGSRQAAPKRN